MIDAIAPRELLLSAALRLLKQGLPARRRSWPRRLLPDRFLSLLIGPRVRAKVMREDARQLSRRCSEPPGSSWPPRGSSAKKSSHTNAAPCSICSGATPARTCSRLFFLGERVRKSDGPKAKPVTRAAVIGAGVMGSGIAQWLSSRGVRVILRDVNPQAVAAGLERIRKLFGDRRVFTEKEARDGLDRIAATTQAVPFDHIDLVIEAAVEKMEAKKQIFAQLDAQASRVGETLLATNTSALALAEIAGATKNPGRVAGFHFFNPVHKMQFDRSRGRAADRSADRPARGAVRPADRQAPRCGEGQPGLFGESDPGSLSAGSRLAFRTRRARDRHRRGDARLRDADGAAALDRRDRSRYRGGRGGDARGPIQRPAAACRKFAGQNGFLGMAGPKERTRILSPFRQGKATPNAGLDSSCSSRTTAALERQELQKRSFS